MDNAILCLLLIVPYAAGNKGQCFVEDPCDDQCNNDCCDKNTLKLNFNSGDVTGSLADFGADYYVNMSNSSTTECDIQAVLNITFAEPPKKEVKCQAKCGRRMLKVQMQMAPESQRLGWMFNFGNSRSNNGFKGDLTHTSFDSEVEGRNETISAHANDYCPDTRIHYSDTMDTCVTVWIGSGFYRIENNAGLVGTQCNETCFYELSRNTNDTERGTTNDLGVFLGFNKVVLPNSPRTGKGLCKAILSWECCWNPPCECQGESKGEGKGESTEPTGTPKE